MNKEFQLLEFADKQNIPHGLIIRFIEDGGAEFVHDVFVEYMRQQLVDKDFLDKYTPVGAVALSRDMVAAIFNNFKEEYNKKNPQ